MDTKPLKCELWDSEIFVNDDLGISFRRTTRVQQHLAFDKTGLTWHTASEAMWINFALQEASRLCNQDLRRRLDGIVDCNGKDRQLIAMTFGSVYSVESQVTDKDAAGEIHLEISPYQARPKPRPRSLPEMPPQGPNGEFSSWISTPPGTHQVLSDCSDTTMLVDMKTMVNRQTCVPPSQQRLWVRDK